MKKRSRTARPTKTRTPQPRFVSKAHRLERDERQSAAFDAVRRAIDRMAAAALKRS